MSKVNFKKSTVKNEIKKAQGPPTQAQKQNSIELVTFANAQTLEPESESEQALSAQAASAKAAPAQAAPAQATPTQAAPAQAAPAQTDPAQTDPAQTDPAQTDPAQATPAQAAPTQAAPAQAEPTQAAPDQESAVQGKMPVETPAPSQSKAPVQPAANPSAQTEKVDSRQSDPYHAAQETERNFTDNDPYHAAQAPERKSSHVHAPASTPAQAQTPDETVAKDEQTEKWEYTKEALQKHYAEQTKVAAPAEKQRQTPHEIVAAIMKRIQESRKGEDHQVVVEPNEDYPESQDGVLRLSDVMSKNVACVVDSTTVEQFAGLCHKRQISAVPIVDYQSMRYLGLISMSDIFSYTFSQKMLTSFDEGVMVQEDPMAVLDLPVRDFMDSQSMMEIGPDCTVQEACKQMVDHQLSHLVITHLHKVKGIFSAWDALSILASPQ